MDYPPFLQENLDLYVLWFFKNRNSIKKGSSHYVKGIFNIIRNGYTFLHKGGEWILYFFVVSVKFLFISSLFYARWLVDLFCSEQLAMFFFIELAIYECIWNSLTSYCLMIKMRQKWDRSNNLLSWSYIMFWKTTVKKLCSIDIIIKGELNPKIVFVKLLKK